MRRQQMSYLPTYQIPQHPLQLEMHRLLLEQQDVIIKSIQAVLFGIESRFNSNINELKQLITHSFNIFEKKMAMMSFLSTNTENIETCFDKDSEQTLHKKVNYSKYGSSPEMQVNMKDGQQQEMTQTPNVCNTSLPKSSVPFGFGYDFDAGPGSLKPSFPKLIDTGSIADRTLLSNTSTSSPTVSFTNVSNNTLMTKALDLTLPSNTTTSSINVASTDNPSDSLRTKFASPLPISEMNLKSADTTCNTQNPLKNAAEKRSTFENFNPNSLVNPPWLFQSSINKKNSIVTSTNENPSTTIVSFPFQQQTAEFNSFKSIDSTAPQFQNPSSHLEAVLQLTPSELEIFRKAFNGETLHVNVLFHRLQLLKNLFPSVKDMLHFIEERKNQFRINDNFAEFLCKVN